MILDMKLYSLYFPCWYFHCLFGYCLQVKFQNIIFVQNVRIFFIESGIIILCGENGMTRKYAQFAQSVI